MAAGFPDGDPNPSITMDLKNVYVLKPHSTGDLTFAIAPNHAGCFVLLDGVTSAAFTGFDAWAIATNAGFNTTSYTSGTRLFGALCDSRLAPSWGAGWGSTAAQAYNSFRPIVAVADACFTGNSLADGGVCTVSSASFGFPKRGIYTLQYDTSKSTDLPREDTTGADTITSVGRTVSSDTFPARRAYTTRVVSGSHEYVPIEPVVYQNNSTDQTKFGFAQRTTNFGPTPGPVYYPGPMKVVSYSGLDATASITVTVRYCVQVTLPMNSSMAPFGAPSPPVNPRELTWYQTITSKLPTVDPSTVGNIARGAAGLARWMMVGSGDGGGRGYAGALGDL